MDNGFLKNLIPALIFMSFKVLTLIVTKLARKYYLVTLMKSNTFEIDFNLIIAEYNF